MTPLIAAAPATGGGTGTLLLLALPFGLLIFLMFSQRRRSKAVATAQAELAVGQQVMAAAGIYGTISELDGVVVHLEIAPGVRIRVARRAIVPDPQGQQTTHRPAEDDA